MSDPVQTGRRARVCTAVQHASTFVIVLGVFVLVAALNTEPSPEGFESFGILLIGVGGGGFLVGWWGRERFTGGSSE